MTDDQAILGCQSGDRDSFRHLVDRYKDVLYGTAFLMTSDRTLAEDQVQLADLANLAVLALEGNQLGGCIPEGLRDVASNDFYELGLPFCDVLLSGLAISPGTLTPPFDSYHTDYTTVVGQSRVTVTPANDHNASLQFLDRNYEVLADADGSLVGHQVDLGAGVTTVRIRVISPDSRATHTYTIVDLVGRYDADDDGAIDREEALDATLSPRLMTGNAHKCKSD